MTKKNDENNLEHQNIDEAIVFRNNDTSNPTLVKYGFSSNKEFIDYIKNVIDIYNLRIEKHENFPDNFTKDHRAFLNYKIITMYLEERDGDKYDYREESLNDFLWKYKLIPFKKVLSKKEFIQQNMKWLSKYRKQMKKFAIKYSGIDKIQTEQAVKKNKLFPTQCPNCGSVDIIYLKNDIIVKKTIYKINKHGIPNRQPINSLVISNDKMLHYICCEKCMWKQDVPKHLMI